MDRVFGLLQVCFLLSRLLPQGGGAHPLVSDTVSTRVSPTTFPPVLVPLVRSATAWSLCSVYHASMRALPVVRTGRPHLLFSAFLLCLFLGHIGYLGLVSFDYGYNMLANVVVVSVSGVLWISWGASQLLRHRRAARHVWLVRDHRMRTRRAALLVPPFPHLTRPVCYDVPPPAPL